MYLPYLFLLPTLPQAKLKEALVLAIILQPTTAVATIPCYQHFYFSFIYSLYLLLLFFRSTSSSSYCRLFDLFPATSTLIFLSCS
jgi:hypothetical protein